MARLAQNIFLRKLAINTLFLHQVPNVKDLFEIIANERQLLPAIIEKDYWLMHCLWGIQKQEFQFELKGGTSLSKGFGIIERFSEDIDIQIHPQSDEVKIGRNHDKLAHITSRFNFFEETAKKLNVPGLRFYRESNFDDPSGKMRGAGIKAEYSSLFGGEMNLKEGVILELGFDQTTPFIKCDIVSWAFDKALSLNLSIIDNRAKNIPCYCPEYTFIEKLQTISTKYRLQQENKIMPINFLRHYYDIYKLLGNERVLNFIGTPQYIAHKNLRFRGQDEIIIKDNPAFLMGDKKIKNFYSKEFIKKSAIYFGKQPSFDEIIQRIKRYIDRL
ncbi:MAG TPA: nucleotidyl transferase AbiEii/AbiGii toxin family protein [Gammaproteobacteria bacterium]|nr:nucleotidyl transferase AbiEii/AbiGii toxin family protein [Gammaproteobacteria bacterium]